MSKYISLLITFSSSAFPGGLLNQKWYGTWDNPIAIPRDMHFRHSNVVNIATASGQPEGSTPFGIDCYAPTVLKEAGTYKMWYGCLDKNGNDNILYSQSTNLRDWSDPRVVITSSQVNATHVNDPTVVKFGNQYHMYYTHALFQQMQNGNTLVSRIGHATSADGINWTIQNPILNPSGNDDWIGTTLARPSVTEDGSKLSLWFNTSCNADANLGSIAGQGGLCPTFNALNIGYSESTDGFTWTAPRMIQKLPTDQTWMDAPEVRKVNNIYVMAISGWERKMPLLYSSNSAIGPWVSQGEIATWDPALNASKHMFGTHNPGIWTDGNNSCIFFGGMYVDHVMTVSIRRTCNDKALLKKHYSNIE